MSKMSGCGKSVALVACSVVCRLLSAGVIYVTPELPEGSDGSGSSWVNAMTSVNDACAAASAAGGGEVWVKKGYYNIIATISLGTNVKVVGGFAGDETDATQADPEANPTVLGGLTHKNGVAKYTPKWSCSGETSSYEVLDRTTWKLNLPPENWFADYDRALISAGTGGMGTIFTTATGSTGALVRGITLYATYTTVITVTASTDLEIDSCLFASCQGGVKNKGTVNIHDSKFVGCYAPFYSETTSTADCIVNRCTMLYCKATSNTENIISFRSGKGKVMNSEIRRCWSIDGSSWFCCLLGSGSVTDTLFEDNTIANDKASIYGGWSFSRCVFRGMLMRQENSSQTLHVACVNFSKDAILEGMVFENNKVAGSRAETSTGTHVWTPTVYSNGGTVLCLNCTFLNNTNEFAISETDKSGTIVTPISGGSCGINFVNCVFSNNRAPTDVYAHGSDAATEKDAMISAFNTIFHSDAKDYQPFSLTSLLSPGIANCCISRWEEVKDTIPTGNNGYLYNITDQDPSLDRSVKTGENGVVALGVGPESPYRKTGRGIWKSSDDRYWFYDDILTGHEWRWRNVQDKRIQSGAGAYQKTNPPPGINADFSSPLLPDAFGAERRPGKIAYGPINAAPHGLAILLQ